MSALGTSLGPQPPNYRLAVANHNHMTSRQSKTVSPRPEMTSRDVHRAGSRGVDRALPMPRPATAPGGRLCDDERVRMMMSGAAGLVVDRDPMAAVYQCATVRPSRPTTAAATGSSLLRESSYDRGQDRAAAGSTARSRLFSPAPHQQYHESSYSAPADCTAHRRPPRPYLPAAAARLPCGPGFRATRVSERTEYHLTSTTRRPTVTSSSGSDGQRSRSSSGSRQGACLWVGVAQIVDMRPTSATALTATVDQNNRKPYCIRYIPRLGLNGH